MIIINYKKQIYQINKRKLISVLSILKNDKVEEKEINDLMKKYKLYDEFFLSQINKI